MTAPEWSKDRRVPRSYSLRDSTHSRVRVFSELTGQSASSIVDELVTLALDQVKASIDRQAGSESDYQTTDALRRTFPDRYRRALDVLRFLGHTDREGRP